MAWSRDGFCGTWNRGALSCTCGRAQSVAPSRSLTAGKIYVMQLMSGVQHQGSETPCSFFFTSEYTDRSPLAPGLFTTIAHMMRRFLRPCDQATRHALLPSSETYTLYCSAEQSMAGGLLSTWANSRQQEYENRVVFFMRQRKAQP